MLSYLSSLIRWLHGFFRIGANFIAQSMMKDVPAKHILARC